jgi:hypothetical protein
MADGTPDPLQAFRLIDERLGAGAEAGGGGHRERLVALRTRLAGELLGAAELVDATLASGFELVTHIQGWTSVLGRDAVLASARGQGEAMVWVELADLVLDQAVLAGHGELRTLSGPSLTTAPFAFFVRFDGALMSSEVLYLDAASETAVPPGAGIPSRESLRAFLGLGHAGPDYAGHRLP